MTSVALTNRALAQSGTRSQITSMTDGSQEALYANILFNPLRDFMIREGDPDWALFQTPAVAAAVPSPWVYGYLYPSDAVRIRQLLPMVTTPLDPQPVEWNVSSWFGTRVIGTKTSIATIFYSSNALDDSEWDSVFTEAFVRLLSSSLIFALENRIEASKEKLTEALNFAGLANLRDS